MKIGPFEVKAVEAGRMRLDGGAMFGSVPRAIWERDHPADDRHRIELSCRIMVLESADRTLIVDTGMGDKWEEKERRIYGVPDDYPPITRALEEQGIDPERVTDVVLTHLHFDHAGGVTIKDRDGRIRPAFPGARHWLQRANLENAQRPNVREKASYRRENFDALKKVELRLLDGVAELAIRACTSSPATVTRGVCSSSRSRMPRPG